MLASNERIAILGASRGLGYSLAEKILTKSSAQLLLSSRKISSLVPTIELKDHWSRVELMNLDFSVPENHRTLIEVFKRFQPTRVFYCAGGGPYGAFQERPWHSHLWALHVNLLFPSALLHSLLSERPKHFQNLLQVIFVGSSIAEGLPDPGASSYACAKHGLKGLIASIVAENSSSGLDLRLYSPGYMNTGMLPPNSRPRQDGSLIAEPQKIADDLLHWALSPPNPTTWHRVLEK